MGRPAAVFSLLLAAAWLLVGLCCAAEVTSVDDGACLLQSRTETLAELTAEAEAEAEASDESGGDEEPSYEAIPGSKDPTEAVEAAWRTAESSERPPDEPFRQSMVNFGDAQYISYLVMGGQLIGGILDTGSFELVVFSSACSSCGAAAQYNPWLSTTYGVGQLRTTQSYGSGDTFSEEAFDLCSIGPFADTNQSFWEVTRANMPILYNAAFQAIIGVGPPETPAADAWNALMKTASNISNATEIHAPIDEGLLAQAVDRVEVAMQVSQRPTLLRNLNVSMFSMCVGRKPGTDGFFIWNDFTPVHKPKLFARVPVVGTHTWSIELKDVRLKGSVDSGSRSSVKSIGCTEGCSAIIDSGTSLLAVPGFIIEQLQAMIEKLDTDCSNIHELPSLVFNMGDGTFTLPPDSYVAEVVGALPNYLEGYTTVGENRTEEESGFDPGDSQGLGKSSGRSRCQLLLMESFASTKYGPLWILGIPFFRRYYTTFRIGSSNKDRTLFMAPSTEDCYPEGSEPGKASLLDVGSRDLYLRRINASRLHAPALARRAMASSYFRL